MSEVNPYESPEIVPAEIPSSQEWSGAFEEATQALAQTRPWVVFLSVLGFIVSAICVVFVPVMVAFGQAGGAPGPETLGELVGVVMAMGMVLLFYLVPSLLLWRYGRQIGRFLESRSPDGLADAITAQKSFWRYVGILMLVIMVEIYMYQ